MSAGGEEPDLEILEAWFYFPVLNTLKFEGRIGIFPKEQKWINAAPVISE